MGERAYTRGVGPARGHDTSGFLWVEEGEHVVGPVATVALIGPFEKVYSYRIPRELADELSVGQRVQVPVGRRARLTAGFCVAIDHRPWDSALRVVDSVIDRESYLTDDLLELGQWMARYYACPLGRTLNALVPEAVRKQSGFSTVQYVRLTGPLERILEANPRVGPKQRAALEQLDRHDHAVELPGLLANSGASRATLRSLAARGWVQIEQKRERVPGPDFDLPAAEPGFELNVDQERAVARIKEVTGEGAFRVVLLFGVSGSGKTEVYIRAMRQVLAGGGQAMLLVPEIALTTQLSQRLASRFEKVAVIHSGLTGVERSLTWAAIRSGEKRVIIGTRSAVFAPCPDLGMIVVDEEQESSYKNLQAPRFHVRDVAIKRGQQLGIPVILGSATPSLETWHNCMRLDHFERIDLPRRVRALPLPTITVVDMRDEYKEKTGIPLLSHVLLRRLGATLSRGEQAVLLMNRRGYANWLMCGSCKHRMVCVNCNVGMVYHAARDELLCHYCHQRMDIPEVCPDPSCRGKLVKFGSGTQRVEERLKRIFPKARIVRMDSDTMRGQRAYRQVISDFEARNIDCLVGTQMIAKGLDFPFVSFVGVVGAETALSIPDFRVGERLFQLVTQVAGRAGRGHVSGEVVVQTLSPDSPALVGAVGHNYAAFAKEELEIRHRAGMPPFRRLTRVVISDEAESAARDGARKVVDDAQKLIAELGLESADVLGPAPCALPRLRNRYRHELLLRCTTAPVMQRLLDELRGRRLLSTKAASLVVDVDPVSLG